jgi:biotin-(acetyl-CoA carboxylase) ligase
MKLIKLHRFNKFLWIVTGTRHNLIAVIKQTKGKGQMGSTWEAEEVRI